MDGRPLTVGDKVAVAVLAYRSASLRYGEISEIIPERITEKATRSRWNKDTRMSEPEEYDCVVKHAGIRVQYTIYSRKQTVWRQANEHGLVEAIKGTPEQGIPA